MSTSLVSIVIPTYNRSQIVCEAIDSCLQQTYPHVEIIVVDDGSTDDTRRTLTTKYRDQIQYIYQENRGPAAARNAGARIARGEFLNFCDADDKFLATKIERCVQVFQKRSELTLVYTRYLAVADDGFTPLKIDPPPLLQGNIFCEMLKSNGSPFQTTTAMIKTSVFWEVGGFNEDPDLFITEDWDFFLRIASRYTLAGIDEKLTLYRHHVEGISKNELQIAKARLRAIQLARHYRGRENCFSDADYNRLEADRWHVLALAQWRNHLRKEARKSLQNAIELAPADARIRRIYRMFSYFLPVQSTDWMNRLLKQWKKT